MGSQLVSQWDVYNSGSYWAVSWSVSGMYTIVAAIGQSVGQSVGYIQ